MTPEERAVKDAVRSRERAIWTDVEKVGRDLRSADKQTMTQAERDTAKKPTEGMTA